MPAQVYFESIDVAYPATVLDPKDQEKIWNQIRNTLTTSDAEILEIIERFKGQIMGFVGAVMHALNNPNFGGKRAQDTELGISTIRAAHLTLGSNATAYGGYIKVSFPTNWVTLAEGTMDKDAGILLFGIVSASDTPLIDGMRITVGQRVLLPDDISLIKLKDNRNGVAVVPFSSVPIMPEQTYKIELYSPDADANTPPEDTIKLLGFTVGLGRFLNANF